MVGFSIIPNLQSHFNWLSFRGPKQEASEDHIYELLCGLRLFNNFYYRSKFGANPMVFNVYVERLFLTFYCRGLLSEAFLEKHRTFIQELGCQQYLFVIPFDILKERIAGTLKHRNKGWLDHVSELGGVDAAVEKFSVQQSIMINAARKLNRYIPTTVLEVADVNNEFYQDLLPANARTNVLRIASCRLTCLP